MKKQLTYISGVALVLLFGMSLIFYRFGSRADRNMIIRSDYVDSIRFSNGDELETNKWYYYHDVGMLMDSSMLKTESANYLIENYNVNKKVSAVFDGEIIGPVVVHRSSYFSDGNYSEVVIGAEVSN